MRKRSTIDQAFCKNCRNRRNILLSAEYNIDCLAYVSIRVIKFFVLSVSKSQDYSIILKRDFRNKKIVNIKSHICFYLFPLISRQANICITLILQINCFYKVSNNQENNAQKQCTLFSHLGKRSCRTGIWCPDTDEMGNCWGYSINCNFRSDSLMVQSVSEKY
mgnify:CR=1 FL=1